VNKIEFYRRKDEAWFLDPKEDFARKSISFEMRRDPLTGHISRIVSFRRKIPEIKVNEEVLEASKKNCPFCPEQLPALTPLFIPEIASEGRLERGGASLFPNSFPYARHSWVVVLSKEHFLSLDQLSTEVLMDGFLVAQEATARVERRDPTFSYTSINWNYLPQSGGGLFHPHLQVVIEEAATASHAKVLKGLKQYEARGGRSFWEDWLVQEMKTDERYAGNQGDIHFLMAFSPGGILGEVVILFSQRVVLKDVTLDDWRAFSEGLVRVFRFLKTKNIDSFNLSIFSGKAEGVQSRVYARLVPRILIPPWNTSDINYFEKLHEEVICVVSPEELCGELKPFFSQSS